jgi:hypothetical protein
MRTLLTIIVLSLAAATGAFAGTCWNRSYGTRTVQTCNDGSGYVTDRHGHKRVFGDPNGGSRRYDFDPPIYERREC